MDLLKKELERKKKAVELAKQQQDSGGKERKFLKASDLRRIQEEQEEQERQRKRKSEEQQQHHQQEEPKSEFNKRQRKEKDVQQGSENASKATKQKAIDNNNDNNNNNDDDVTRLSPEKVMQQLRALGLPIRLFGEDEAGRLERLRHATERQQHVMAGLSEMDEFRLGSGHGIRNPFLESKKEQQEALQESVAQDDTKKKQARKDKDNEDSDDDDPHKRIYRFLKGLLRQWEDDLALRPEAVKRSAAGRNETKTLKQCKDYIRPLFKLCKTRRLEESLMVHLIKIVQYCEEGEFVKANDSYLDVAIGRAAWPIGVTMVGIHARSGRAKIESSNVAHVMNSELQRKYLTSVKRLMSYCQSKRKDVAPSKKVLS
jgi:pre-mRNA-splicing factor 18